MIENKKYYIDEINSSKAFKMTSLYHYSGTGFKKAILNLGIFRKEDNLMVGVLQWGCSFQEKIKLNRYVKEPIKKEEYLELNRFCMADTEGKNSESQAISLGIQWIKRYRPNIRLLVSYAGRKEGNYGYIYQATNWEYLGYFISNGFWSVDGHEKHLITLWCNYNRSKSEKGFYDYLCEKYQDVRQTWTKQFIYIQRLDNTLTTASEVLPYPKPTNEYPIKIKEKILKENQEIYNNPLEIPRVFVKYYYEKDKYLFSKATLKRRGELKEDKRRILMYDSFGKFEKEFNDIKLVKEDGFTISSVRKALKSNKIYKDKYFKYIFEYEEIPQEIEVPFVCLIDEIPFPTYAEAARYLGVSRQAVQQSSTRKSKKVGGKDIIWG